jgi:hypothetical protein
VQSVVGWNRRGVVTGANMFTRSLGSAVGVAVFGSIANTTLATQFRNAPPGIASHLHSATLAFSGKTADPKVAAYIRHALYLATHRIFWALVVAAVFGLVTQLILPRRTQMLRFPDDPPPAPGSAG